MSPFDVGVTKRVLLAVKAFCTRSTDRPVIIVMDSKLACIAGFDVVVVSNAEDELQVLGLEGNDEKSAFLNSDSGDDGPVQYWVFGKI